MSGELPLLEMLARLSAATGLAMLLGLERELRGKPAGLRSHMLVALGAASFMLIGMDILLSAAEGKPGAASIDPTRIIEGVIGGIGFLGAGSIIRSNTGIQGITTGAAIWTVGAIGVACGAGELALAAVVTALALVIVVVLGLFERGVIEEGQDP
ncbi:hypothetical protein KBTX_01320 [wastewater metagenome]|uniref:MgtC/SapB/SrpB/YhiD N-terminal domain-containing protein n=2 Tax=unclassified sequences TaxID=12908 RepID=A0A5B8R8Z4_9ZZZZ|nr:MULTISPECIES: MgtC/SapB family protein [Arhodomonas]MCS4505213.1 MgtC/SapB family protein [Arhodomonas aquaeolei]QEA05001.1 hypothetical protein KBTEX_01320 [uncultured organism]